jgi:hypothetical protein
MMSNSPRGTAAPVREPVTCAGVRRDAACCSVARSSRRAVEDRVDELVAVRRAEFLRQLDAFVEHDPIRHLDVRRSSSTPISSTACSTGSSWATGAMSHWPSRRRAPQRLRRRPAATAGSTRDRPPGIPRRSRTGCAVRRTNGRSAATGTGPATRVGAPGCALVRSDRRGSCHFRRPAGASGWRVRARQSAASAPLLPALVPARSTACSIVSVVSTPKAIGTPVSSAARARPAAHWLQT